MQPMSEQTHLNEVCRVENAALDKREAVLVKLLHAFAWGRILRVIYWEQIYWSGDHQRKEVQNAPRTMWPSTSELPMAVRKA